MLDKSRLLVARAAVYSTVVSEALFRLQRLTPRGHCAFTGKLEQNRDDTDRRLTMNVKGKR
jgi:hypothetical protein